MNKNINYQNLPPKINNRYGGREFSLLEIKNIKNLVTQSPALNRAALSRLVCEHLNWRKPDGGLKEMRCRVAMIEMDKVGLIKLPTPLNKSPAQVKKAIVYTDRTKPQAEIVKPVHKLGNITLSVVQGRKQASLWNEFIDRYHYLGHKTLPGAQMRFIVKADDQIIALLGFGSAAWKTAPRDNYIGWDAITREKNLYLVINNSRFLILPWIKSPNLATKLLSLTTKYIKTYWEQRYGYSPVLLETFVEIPRFTGHCYKAANWVCVGRTTGRGRMSSDGKSKLPKKDIWLYPLQKKFRKILNV